MTTGQQEMQHPNLVLRLDLRPFGFVRPLFGKGPGGAGLNVQKRPLRGLLRFELAVVALCVVSNDLR